jgi:DNA-binding NtrC family response regulator
VVKTQVLPNRGSLFKDFARTKLVGESPKFRQVLDMVDRVAGTIAPVLISGETGTGKELTARAIHYSSDRREQPFIPINCGAIPDNLIESELFGHVEGAFTGAKHTHSGLLSEANGGTLFLDEIEALSPKAQVVLLRFLEDHSYRPVGHTKHHAFDARILSAVNVDLRAAAQDGSFRRDLLYRLAVCSVVLPPLRERGNDRQLLAERFVRECSAQYARPERPLTDAVRDIIDRYDWPGNVRELRNFIHSAFVMSVGSKIELPPPGVVGPQVDSLKPKASSFDVPLSIAKARISAEFERDYIVTVQPATSRRCGSKRRYSACDQAEAWRSSRSGSLGGSRG